MILVLGQDPAAAFARCGTKAHNLARLAEAGFAVPGFACVDATVAREGELAAALLAAGLTGPFAVRSSAEAEDGENTSFAGQFATFLDVAPTEVDARVRECLATQSSYAYGQEREAPRWAVVQQMVASELSGVMFTRNPLGVLSERVIVVGRGVGSGVVEDKVPVSTYYHSTTDGLWYRTRQEGAPELAPGLRDELDQAASRLEEVFGRGIDAEFAVSEGRLFLLQARRITTLLFERPLVLDNSNIVESYPGTTTTLTADFVTRQYAAIFKGVVSHLAGGPELSHRYEDVFDHMVEYWSGRMYYQLGNWYGVIGLLPFSRKILPVWREMLGVSPTDELPTPFVATRAQRASIALHTAWFFLRAPRMMRDLEGSMREAERLFAAYQAAPKTLADIRRAYGSIVDLVMRKWDYTLINDMYTFLHTGLYRAAMRRRGASDKEMQAALGDVSYLVSLAPVRELLSLAQVLRDDGRTTEFDRRLASYVERFGDRSIGELKLETSTYRERPDLLLRQVEQYAALPNLDELSARLYEPSGDVGCGGAAGFFLRRAKRGVEGRERSRLDRTRLFGFARTMFLQAGELLCQSGRIAEPRDVFHLTMDKLFDEDGGDYRALVTQRKEMLAAYEQAPACARVVFDGRVVPRPFSAAVTEGNGNASLLTGTPCSEGHVVAPVLVVRDAASVGDPAGKILVTHSTDPGWAFMLSSAAGLVSERGSLLSHTAIIARELGVPAIVGVRGALQQLKDGDVVELDCATGFVRRVPASSAQTTGPASPRA